MAFVGILLAPAFGATVGAGFGAALYSKPEWMDVWDATESTPALVEIICRPLRGVRYFFIFVLGWTMVANKVFNLYSIGISMQVFGPTWQNVPRFFFTFLASITITLLSVFSRNSFYSILSNLGSIIGYWTAMFFVIVVEDDLIFRRRIGYDLSAWNDRTKLPVGLAVDLPLYWYRRIYRGYGSNLVSWVSYMYSKLSLLSANKNIRPIAMAIAPDGGDIGTVLGFAFCGISYLILRHLELKKFGR